MVNVSYFYSTMKCSLLYGAIPLTHSFIFRLLSVNYFKRVLSE
uniref:Uncharacterized protein n=1 Tax=Anguilla anguilla TaxID=7936 RepID=A0A0E9U3E2_ANGAN